MKGENKSRANKRT